jgi:hypothetical protein
MLRLLIFVCALLLGSANCQITFYNSEGSTSGTVNAVGCTNTPFATNGWSASYPLSWYYVQMYDGSGCTGKQLIYVIPYGVSPDSRPDKDSIRALGFSENDVYWNRIHSVRVATRSGLVINEEEVERLPELIV